MRRAPEPERPSERPERARRPEPAEERPAPRKGAEPEGVMGLFDKWLDEPQKKPSDKRAPEPPARPRAERPAPEPPAPPASAPGIRGLEIQKKIGEDGLGETYTALHTFLGRPVFVRILSGSAAQDRAHAKEFAEVARANAKLNHQNTIQVYDAGQFGDGYYVVSEVPEGLTLNVLMSREGKKRPIPVNLAIELVLQLARALRRAHAEKLVHWDLRPTTVFVSRERIAKIGGFSLPQAIIRHAMAAGEMTSKLPVHAHMPPEVIQNIDTADARADIYGLCAVFYEMVTGRPPFAAASERDLMDDILRTRPEAPQKHNASLPPELSMLILKGLAKEPSSRFATAADLVKELKALPRAKSGGDEE